MTREEAREQVANIYAQAKFGNCLAFLKTAWHGKDRPSVIGEIRLQESYQIADRILSLPFIAIVDRKAKLPENPYPIEIFPMNLAECTPYIDPAHLDAVSGAYGRYFYRLGQEDMIEAGWVKEVQ